MPHDIVKLSQKILGNPEKVTVQPEQTTAEKVDQAVYFVDKKGKSKLLIHLLQDDAVYSALVFSRTKHGADKIVRMLSKSGIEAHALHGNKSQGQRQKALGNFKNGRINVLVATDIAARGIDVDELSHVINFDLPNMPETYIHRIGRTGRAGASGTALSFCDSDEKAYLRDIQKLIGQKIPVIADHPFINGTSEGSDETELNHVRSRATQQNRQNGNGSNSNGSYNGKRKPGGRKSRNKRRFNTSRKASFSSRG
jgi:ATP-dependent RNA helicase RhlE